MMKKITILFSCIAAINPICTEARSLLGYMDESSSIPEDEQASEEPNRSRSLYVRRVFEGGGLVRRGYYRPNFSYRRPGVGLATGLLVGSVVGAAVANNRNNYYNYYNNDGYYDRNLGEASPVDSEFAVKGKAGINRAANDWLPKGAGDSNSAGDTKQDQITGHITDEKDKDKLSNRISKIQTQQHKYAEVRDLGKYPGYAGAAITGHARFYFHDDVNVTISYYLEGVDHECNHPNMTAPNSCGIHIHAGTSCADASQPGGHYYDKTTTTTDPWTHIEYSKGIEMHSRDAAGHVHAEFGYGLAQSVGHILVVHDYTGARATCAVITEHK